MSNPIRVAVIGAGPAGFYACEDLLKQENFEVDLYDALPAPFGLVRAGLAHAQVEHVIMVGRRGPAQASFTNPELLELGELRRCDVIIDPAEVELDEHSKRWLEEHGDKTARRNVEILTEYSQREPSGKSHRIEL